MGFSLLNLTPRTTELGFWLGPNSLGLQMRVTAPNNAVDT